MKLYNIVSFIGDRLNISHHLPLDEAIAAVYPEANSIERKIIEGMILLTPFYTFDPAPQAEFFAIDHYDDGFFLAVIRYEDSIQSDALKAIQAELSDIVQIFHGDFDDEFIQKILH